MRMKSLLLVTLATLGLTVLTMAQNVPNYVPTNGLIGWWPFNGNANDDSGNANNGLVNGATLTSDRFNNSNTAYNFDGINDYISINNQFDLANRTFNYWFNPTSITPITGTLIVSDNPQLQYGVTQARVIKVNNEDIVQIGTGLAAGDYLGTSTNTNNWQMLTYVRTTDSVTLFLNGIFVASTSQIGSYTSNVGNTELIIGTDRNLLYDFYEGNIDDIGIWNRALTQQEITDLYNALNCANNTTITPQTNSLVTGNTASFTATTSDPNPNFFWQSDYGQGYVTLNNYGNYSGVNTNSLSIANVQLSEHNQPIRVITTSGNCIDTSNVAIINILDTCITNVTIYDTLLTTVTDTLVINAIITGINPPNNLNTLKVFPNPASTHITIDYGNFNAMSGYTLTIINSVGQTVFTTPINQQSSYVDLSTWSGNGIYFVQIIDTQNNIFENRKIVLQ